MPNFQFSHAALVARAVGWLRNNRGCCPVFRELVSNRPGEIADAIGWHSGRSILIECKISRNDFQADKRKTFRQTPELGVGIERYYMTPPAMVDWDEVPNGWGLLEYDGRKVKGQLKSGQFKCDKQGEIEMLCSALRRTWLRLKPMEFHEFLKAVPGTMADPLYVVRARCEGPGDKRQADGLFGTVQQLNAAEEEPVVTTVTSMVDAIVEESVVDAHEKIAKAWNLPGPRSSKVPNSTEPRK